MLKKISIIFNLFLSIYKFVFIKSIIFRIFFIYNPVTFQLHHTHMYKIKLDIASTYF